MRWNHRPPFVPPSYLDRPRLRRIAVRYAEHGWPVVPGAYLAGTRFVCGRPGCPTAGCHPAVDGWQHGTGTDLGQVALCWQHHPYSILLATGVAFDVLEAPAQLGLRALGTDRPPAALGPVAVTPGGRWMFLVRPGEPLRPELAAARHLLHHGEGSWIPAPPTRMAEGRVRWAVPPERVQWRLPGTDAVQGLLADALRCPGRAVRAPEPRPVVPRQNSTRRRAA